MRNPGDAIGISIPNAYVGQQRQHLGQAATGNDDTVENQSPVAIGRPGSEHHSLQEPG